MALQEKNSLIVENLCVAFEDGKKINRIVKNVNLEIKKGLITALVGESGSGKTVTSLSIMNLLPPNGKIVEGKIKKGEKVIAFPNMKKRKTDPALGMIFQDPSASLNPLFTVGQQMIETIKYRERISAAEAEQKSISFLEAVKLQDADFIMSSYPFELSGGMCQRVMIAITLALRSEFIIADEPTTALDVTVQKQILEQIYSISRDNNVGVLFITHDLGVVAEIADYVYIMQKGSIVEENDVFSIFENPQHPYSKMLLGAIL